MLKKETQKYIQTGQKVHHIPFGIDTEKFIVNSELKDNNTIYIGTVKSLEEKYGISCLIQAFAQVKMQITYVELIIVGVGSLFNKLVKLAESLGINNSITFAGKVENDEVVHYLHKMDIFVMPSEGGAPRQLTWHSGHELPFGWSPDGQHIAFGARRNSPNYEIFTVNAGTFKTELICQDYASMRYPRWSPDGSKIAFTTDRDGNDEIYVMNADGSNQTRLTNNEGDDISPSW